MEELNKRVRNLTIAVWGLAVFNALTLASLMLGVVAFPKFSPSHAHPTAEASPFESWDGMAFQERAKRATLVLVTDYQSEGGMVRAYIREELKRAPGTAFDFRVGEEYPPLVRKLESNTSYGEGALVLLAGSPAEFRESMSIQGGNVYVATEGGGRTALTLSEARRLVMELK